MNVINALEHEYNFIKSAEKYIEDIINSVPFIEFLSTVEPRVQLNYVSDAEYFSYLSCSVEGVGKYSEMLPLIELLEDLYSCDVSAAAGDGFTNYNFRNEYSAFTLSVFLADKTACKVVATGKLITITKVVEVEVPEFIAVCPEE